MELGAPRSRFDYLRWLGLRCIDLLKPIAFAKGKSHAN